MATVIFPARTKAFSALPQSTYGARRDSIIGNNPGAGSSVKRIKLTPPIGSVVRPVIDAEVHLDQILDELVNALPSLVAPNSATRPLKPLPLQHLLGLAKVLCTPNPASIAGAKPFPPNPARLEKLYNAAKSILETAGHEVGKSLRAEGMTMGLGSNSAGPSTLHQGGSRSTSKGQKWLELILSSYEDYQYRSNLLISVLAHLGPAYIFPSASASTASMSKTGEAATTDTGVIKTLKEISLDSFRDGALLGERVVKERAEEAIRSWLEANWAGDEVREKEGLVTDGVSTSETTHESREEDETIRRFLSVTIHLDATQPFRETYISAIQTYHSARSSSLLSLLRTIAGPGSQSGYTSTQYVSWIYNALGREEQRVDKVWCGETRREGTVVRGLEGEVWAEVRKGLLVEVVEKGVLDRVRDALDEGVDNKDHEALKRLYRLVTSVGKFTVFRKALTAYVQTRATSLISDTTKDAEMVPNLLFLKRELDASISALYDTEDEANQLSKAIAAENADAERKELRRRLALESEVRDGLKMGVESRQAVPAEMIAKHLDQVMRKGQGSSTTIEFEALLDEIVALVKFTKDKDVFKEFFTSQLAKRLLLSKSASGEEEMSMVKKLQREYGEEFTSGDAMMKDLSTSEDMNKRFSEVRQKNGKTETKLTVNVLSQGHWPPYKQLQEGWENLTLPKEMQKSLDEFAGWYNHTYSGRVLSWRHQHTSVTLTARFPGGNKEIGVSLFQSLVLLQFSSPSITSLTFEELLANTGIERTELIRTLQSLFGNKQTRMLNKKPGGKEVVEGDRFAWNEGFTRDRIRFKINQLQQDMSAEESKQTSLKVFEDRTMTLDAQIVRIMKGAKQMSLSELVNETVKAVERMFVPEVKGIKEQVESLIEREYMERDDNDRNLLKYLA